MHKNRLWCDRVTVSCVWSEVDHPDDWSSKQPLSVALDVKNWYAEVVDIDGNILRIDTVHVRFRTAHLRAHTGA
jgi:hypothetical protein